MIFGRAGGEIARLHDENIPGQVVPGITSTSAMAPQLGASLTHRDHAPSVRFVTDHSRNGELPFDIDWSRIADPNTTSAFYMGGRTATKISTTSQNHGLSGHMSVVISKSILPIV